MEITSPVFLVTPESTIPENERAEFALAGYTISIISSLSEALSAISRYSFGYAAILIDSTIIETELPRSASGNQAPATIPSLVYLTETAAIKAGLMQHPAIHGAIIQNSSAPQIRISILNACEMFERTKKLHEIKKEVDLVTAVAHNVEDVLYEREANLDTFFTASSDIFYVTNEHGVVQKINETGAEKLGYRVSEIVGESVTLLYPSDIAESVWKAVTNMLHGDQKMHEFPLLTKAGKLIEAETRVVAGRWNGGTAIFTVVRDVTERKEAERANRFMNYSLNQTRDSILRLNNSGVIRYINDTALSLLDYNREDLINRHISVVDPIFREQPWGRHMALLREQKQLVQESRFVCKDGRSFPVEVTSNHIAFEDEEGSFAIVRDLTDVREQEWVARFVNHAVDNARDGIFWLNRDARVCYANQAALDALQYEKHEIIGMHVSEWDPDFPHEQWSSFMIELRKKGHLTVESRHKRKDGSFFPVEITANYVAFEGDDGNFAFVRDISEWKQAEKAVRESEEKYRLLIEISPYLIGIFSDWKIRFLNPAGISMFGASSFEELRDKDVMDFIHPDSRELLTAHLQRGYDEGRPVYLDDIILCRPDSSIIYIEISAITFQYQGSPAVQLIASDITGRKNMEKMRQAALTALIDSEEKFRTLFENIVEGIALFEISRNESGMPDDYKTLAVNPAYLEITGFTARDLIGKSGREIFDTTRPPYFDEYERVAFTRIPFRFETYLPQSRRYVMTSVVSPRQGQFATVLEDITDRKKREEELKQKNEELARFIYTVSHDLKSPLVTIKAFTGYLLEDIQKGDEEAREKDISFIQKAADRMGLLLNELLELSRIGRKENPRKEVSLQSVVQAALELVAGRIAEKKVQIVVTDLPIVLYCDQQRIIQLYQNLIDNAVKFMGTQENPVVEAGAKCEGEDIILFVRDNGSGIDPRYFHKLFGLFEKLDTGSEGTGIGLALVKRILEVHGGAIRVESEGPGMGATFYFTMEKTRLERR